MKYVLVLLADLANGLFAVLLAGHFTGTEPVWWHFLIGIPLAMSPDLDAVGELIERRGRLAASAEYGRDHREGLHYPILFLIGGVVATTLAPYWGTIFLVAVILHFANDFYGTGWGIKLLWPFSNRQYKLLGRRANLLKRRLVEEGLWETLPEAERRLRLVVSWSSAELSEYTRKYGRSNWIDIFYRRLNWVNGAEYTLFLVALILTLVTLL